MKSHVLCVGGHMMPDGQGREIGTDFGHAEVERVARLMKSDEVANDAEVGLFGAIGEIP
jgi:hypothetical protein